MREDVILLPGLEGYVYKGPTYLELNKKLKSNPLVYNLIQQNIAKRNNPTKEIVSYKDANGNTLSTTNISAGILSPVDPVGEFYVAGKVLDPAFKVAGNLIANSGYIKYTKKYGLDRLEWKGLRGKNSYIELKPEGEWMSPIFMQSTKSGIGKKLYDAAIKYALSKGYKGIKSGENLLSAPKTYSIWKHYPNKILLGTNGSHTNVNMYGKRGVLGYKKVNSPEELILATLNGEKAVLENGNIYGLNSFNKNIYIKEKQGGKMNILQFLKSGSGIYIKKENRGKFTDYCGGKVTSECIAKGKRSSNPAIRKRATFAANARKWKHLEGGTLTYEQWQLMTPELKTAYNKNIAKSFLSSPTLPNLYNSVKAYFGGYAPENLYLQTGIAPSPGMSSKALALLGKTKNAYNVERLLSKKSMLSGIKIPVETIKDAIKTGDVPLVSTKIVEPIKEAGLTIRKANPVMLENYVSNPAEQAAMLDFKTANPNVYVGKTKMSVGRPSLKVMKEIMYPLAFEKWLGKPSQPLKATTELPEKIVKSEAAKLNSVEQGYSKTRRSKDKIERAFEYTDARHANAGQSRVKKANEKWILDIIEKEGGPWESKLLYFRRKMADSEKGSIRYNNGKQGIKQLIEDYKKLRGYKKGGKAFVKGVSVLDSNPDAYKYVKKKIKKAADGGNSKNWFSGVGNWLNKNLNTISTIGSAITNGVGLIKQNSELSKAKAAKEKELDAKYNPNNLIDDSEIWNEVNNQISLLELLNPDVHYGEVDKLNLYNKVRNQYLSKAKQYALFAKTLELQLYNLYISNAQAGNTSSLMNLIGNGISTGIGMLGNKSTTSTGSVPTGTTTTSYSSYAPGYTPSLPKTFSEYVALNYKK